MDAHGRVTAPELIDENDMKIRSLAKSALRQLVSEQLGPQSRTRQDWVARLVDALILEAEGPHHVVIGEIMSSGASSEEVLQSIIPEASRLLGELWVCDKISFVDVTVGAGRLQKLFRERTGVHDTNWLGRTTPLGQPVLMVIPEFEDHSLGAFIAADGLRRHGLWVHMSIGLSAQEVLATVSSHRFAMIGISISMQKHVANTAELIDMLRQSDANLPPVVIGGRAAEIVPQASERTGADFAALSVREAIELCGLTSIAPSLGLDRVG